MKIAIIGMGHVGTAMRDLLRHHAELVTYDAAEPVDYPTQELAACDAAIVCVGTPMAGDGRCDTSHVQEAVRRLPVGTVLLKSTVPPGTTDLLSSVTGKQICMSPEYVGQSSYPQPYWPGGVKEVPFVILGGEPPVRRRFIDMLQPVLGPAKVYFQCSAREAEIIKYMENAYLAAKVTFVNEFRRICQTFGADWHTVREGWLLDPRAEPAHTAAFAGAPGFSGNCLPKDLSAIIHAAASAGYNPALLKEIQRSNERFRSAAPAPAPAETSA
jgi:nucleotide sugar dehydrogenase